MGCRRGDAGGVDREEEREEGAAGVRGEAAQGDDGGGAAGGVAIVSLGLARSKPDAVREEAGEPCRERSGLGLGDGEGQGFGVSCGSMAFTDLKIRITGAST